MSLCPTADSAPSNLDAPFRGQERGRALSVDAAGPSAGELANAITDQLRDYLAERRRDSAYIGDAYADVTGALEEFVLRGGKRVRPAFAYSFSKRIPAVPWSPQLR